MVLCEHFIFTSADLEEKGGYQVISKSSKITPELLDELEDYLYPSGLEPNKFSESKSMLILKDKIAFTKAKNIGIGYDGRSDTVYSHTIVMAIEDFKKFQYDSRVFDDFFLFKKNPEHLAPLVIEPTKHNPDFSCINVLGIVQFEDFLRSVFSKKKIAILNIENKNLIQSLISLLPPNFRLISFSTLVAQPHRQSRFELIQTQSTKSSLEKYFVIDPQERKQVSPVKDTVFEQCIRHLIDIIDSKNSHKLTEIYDEFEDIEQGDYKEKFSLIIGTLLLDPQHPVLLDQKSIKELLLVLDNVPTPKIIEKYYPKITPFLSEDDKRNYSLKYEKIIIISNSANEELTYDKIVKMFNDLSDGYDESRLSLFHQLVKTRKNDFAIHGAKILLDSVYDFYNLNLIRGFLTNPALDQCIYDALENPKTEHKKRKVLFAMLVEFALCYNTKWLGKLYAIKVYDLNNYDDAKEFRDVTRNLFEANEFCKNLEPKIIFSIIQQIHDRIDPEFPRNKKSGITGDQYYYMQDVLFMLLNTLRYMLTVRKLSLGETKKWIKEKESDLTHFLNLHHLPRRGFLLSFDIFSSIPSPFVWTLFSRFSKKCKNS